MTNLDAVQKRIEELNPMLLDIENRIAASTSQKDRTELEGERSKLATEYNEKQAKEQELLAESQTLERYTSMFQTFVDSLNNQIAAQNTLINKLTIDTEQRIVLYKALEDSLKTAAQQDVAHKINTLGTQVDNTAEETMAGIGAAAQKHIGDLLELHEKNMVATADIQRRKKLADDAFARRFDEVLRKHNASDYVQVMFSGKSPSRHPPMTTRSRRSGRPLFRRHRGGAGGSRDFHARRPLAALSARRRRQDRRRIHRAAGDLFLLLEKPSRLHRQLPHLARRKRLPGLPEPARAGKRPPPGRAAAGHHPRAGRAARRDGRLHPAPQGIPGSAAEVDGRAALS